MHVVISLKTTRGDWSSASVSAGCRSLSSVTLWMEKDSFKKHLYLVNTFLDTLLDVTIFLYVKWIQEKKISQPFLLFQLVRIPSILFPLNCSIRWAR